MLTPFERPAGQPDYSCPTLGYALEAEYPAGSGMSPSSSLLWLDFDPSTLMMTIGPLADASYASDGTFRLTFKERHSVDFTVTGCSLTTFSTAIVS